MDFYTMFSIRDYALIILAATLVFFIYEIFRLKKVVEKKEVQIRDSFIPVLLVEINQQDSVLYIKNENSCHIKDIKVEDLSVTLGYGFQKRLTFKFDTINHIGPEEKVELKFRIFDKEYEVTSKETKKVIPLMEQGVFEFHMKYANVENRKFEAILLKDKGNIFIKKVVPVKGVI